MADEHAGTVAAGPITFVVEHRTVVQDGVEAGGPTIRVMGAADDHEYLRFDMFNVKPHYHYEPPEHDERILMLDTVADGDAVAWALSRLRDRLTPMLVAADAATIADALDERTVATAIDRVESLVRAPA
jgi:hypothetical protein